MAFQVGTRMVGGSAPPLVIAELSGNHGGSLDRALSLVDAAADAGAHALKLQTYTADSMTLDLDEGDFRIDDEGSLWKGRTLYSLYQEAHTPWSFHAPIFERARARGMIPLSTPFDAHAVEQLETLGAGIYKIASFESIDLPLLRRVAATGRPVILSTGMATLSELDLAVRTLRDSGCPDIVLLKCTSSYPASPEHSNVRTIAHMKDLFDCEVGLSDHTMGLGAAVAAVALGASVIEKHFTLARADGGVDAAFSLEPLELRALVTEVDRAWKSLGTVTYGPNASESTSRKHRRSLYVTEDLSAGDRLTERSLRAIRPGNGLSPEYTDLVLGCRVTRDVKRGTPLSWDLILDR